PYSSIYSLALHDALPIFSGMEVGDSIARAVGTSGNAVVFAGLTVIIALAALAVPGLPFLTILGLSAAFTVFCSVILNITLLPALDRKSTRLNSSHVKISY